MAQPIRFKACVDEVHLHTPDVASFKLRAEQRLPRFKPGQFIHLTMDDYDPANFWPESRVFSVANAVADRRSVELTISRQGEYTSRILDTLIVGDSLWAKGPYGEFTIDGEHGYRRAILIAGGTGITPFCAFMDAALKESALPVDEVVLHYGAQTPDLLIYRALSDRCAVELPGFKVQYYAEEMLSDDDPSIQRGRLALAKIIANAGPLDDSALFLSGPKAMITGFQATLTTTYGLSPEQVLVDAWE